MTTFEEMGLPTPKYKKGDVVYYIEKTTIEHRPPCPDCQGTKLWAVKTPAGEEFNVSCPRCGGGYGVPPLRYWEPSFTIIPRTIGLIKINDWSDTPVSYMCTESGIGSGSVYYEKDLFADKDVARDVGNIWLEEAKIEYAAKKETQHNARAKELSVRTFVNAKIEEAQQAQQDSESKLRNLLYALNDEACSNFYDGSYNTIIKEEDCRKFINHLLVKAGFDPLED